METPAQFDLTTAQKRWRENLARSTRLGGEELDELEEHMLDAVARWERTGMAPAAAFQEAVRRLGEGRVLAKEFAKVKRKFEFSTLTETIPMTMMTLKKFTRMSLRGPCFVSNLLALASAAGIGLASFLNWSFQNMYQQGRLSGMAPEVKESWWVAGAAMQVYVLPVLAVVAFLAGVNLWYSYRNAWRSDAGPVEA